MTAEQPPTLNYASPPAGLVAGERKLYLVLRIAVCLIALLSVSMVVYLVFFDIDHRTPAPSSVRDWLPDFCLSCQHRIPLVHSPSMDDGPAFVLVTVRHLRRSVSHH